MLHRLWQDIRHALRKLRRAPAFPATAILTLAIGIGLATAVFTAGETFLLRPLPIRDQSRVVVLWGATADGRFANFPLILSNARRYARGTHALERVEFFSYGAPHITAIRDGSSITRMRGTLVSGGFFNMLGAQPVLGRALMPDDDVTGAAPVVVLSFSAWQRYFGGDPRVIGRHLVTHSTGIAHRIVGVMPLGLDYPVGTDFWTPVVPNSGPLDNEPVYAELNVIARLKPGVAPIQARDELTAFFSRSADPWQRQMRGVIHPLTTAILGDVKPAVIAFASAAAVLLLITCINVASLLLVRGLGRAREVAVRTALGASRARIALQLLVESLVLAIAGGMVGVLFATGAVRAFIAFAPAGTPRLDEIHLDVVVVGGAVGITALATLLFALVPALVSSRVGLQDVLRSGARLSSASRRFRLGAEALVIGQVALALLVLSAAGLITRSLLALDRVDLAFDPTRLMVAELSIPVEGYASAPKQLALLDAIVPRLEALPGVRSVAPVLTPPFGRVGGIFGQLDAEGQSKDGTARNPTLIMDVVTPSFFSTFGIPILRGRGFTESDRAGAPTVVVLSASAARHYWPTGDPIGRRLTTGTPGEFLTVVGIVPETRYRDLRDPRPTVYFPLRQSFFPVVPMTLALRTDARASDLVPAMRRAIADVEPGVALATASSFETLLEAPRAQPRLNALLLATFAVGALVLAAIGLFAVMATMVRQRTRELGVRMAIGATAGDVGRLVLRRGMGLAALGAVLGLGGAIAANRLLASMLFEVSPTDVPTLAIVTAILMIVAGTATLIPAHTSTRIEPIIAMRSEG